MVKLNHILVLLFCFAIGVVYARDHQSERKLADGHTNQDDVDAITRIKATYGVTRNWQGDPCLPANSTWEGIRCVNITDDPRIISLNLSQNELRGKISPDIAGLEHLQYLDLSNNSLTGDVPAFLAEMENLQVLILSSNHLSGLMPAKLAQKANSGLLKLSIDGNPNLCSPEGCKDEKGNTTPSPPQPITSLTKSTATKGDNIVPVLITAVAYGLFIFHIS